MEDIGSTRQATGLSAAAACDPLTPGLFERDMRKKVGWKFQSGSGYPLPVSARHQWKFLRWPKHVLIERHSGQCSCSYCDKATGRFGVWLPQCKAWNSWRVVYWRLRHRYYVRWTLPRWLPLARGSSGSGRAATRQP